MLHKCYKNVTKMGANKEHLSIQIEESDIYQIQKHITIFDPINIEEMKSYRSNVDECKCNLENCLDRNFRDSSNIIQCTYVMYSNGQGGKAKETPCPSKMSEKCCSNVSNFNSILCYNCTQDKLEEKDEDEYDRLAEIVGNPSQSDLLFGSQGLRVVKEKINVREIVKNRERTKSAPLSEVENNAVCLFFV
jgi:hypothetical protein